MSFIDTFTELSANTNLEDHTPDTGAGWTLVTGSPGDALVNHVSDDLSGANSTGTRAFFSCDDQGSADHASIVRTLLLGGSYAKTSVACRVVDTDNWVGYMLAGSGGAGRRLSKCVAGIITDLITSQGVIGEWVKAEVEGGNARLYEGGIGSTPSWTQVGLDQTYTESTTETTQGIIVNDSASSWITDFQAESLAPVDITTELSSGSFALTGAAIGALYDRLSELSAGSYALTGSDISTLLSLVSSLDSGAYTLTGSDIASLRDHLSELTSGSYSLTGSDIDTVSSAVVIIESGSYDLTGSDIGSLNNHVGQIDAGVFLLTGSDIDTFSAIIADIAGIELVNVTPVFALSRIATNDILLTNSTVPIRLERQ